jgi:hypothetical protein
MPTGAHDALPRPHADDDSDRNRDSCTRAVDAASAVPLPVPQSKCSAFGSSADMPQPDALAAAAPDGWLAEAAATLLEALTF